MALIGQEVTTQEWIDIPGPVLDVYRTSRPSPLHRARRLEAYPGTPARICYKYEGVSPAGSHKPNTAIAQAYYNKAEGVRRLATETGAGQWGSALAMASAFFGLECQVYMVVASYRQKPGRRTMMETWGARVVASPSDETAAGRAILAGDPDSPGSLGIAISEAVEDAANREDTKYALGSVLNHVLLHQTVIGLEARQQMELAGDTPDIVIGCVGGGSNFAGLVFPFVSDKTRQGGDLRFLAVEPTACPTLTEGAFEYDVRRHRRDGTPRVRPHRGHHPGPRVRPCDPGGNGRGPGLQGDRRVPGDPLRPLGPRPAGPDRVPGLPPRQPDRRLTGQDIPEPADRGIPPGRLWVRFFVKGGRRQR